MATTTSKTSNHQLLRLAPPLNADDGSFLKHANLDVLFGWKRDVGRDSRMVYYAARLEHLDKGVHVRDQFLCYKHRTSVADARILYDILAAAQPYLHNLVGNVDLQLRQAKSDRRTLWLAVGTPSPDDDDRVSRLQRRRPRRALGNPNHVITNATIPSVLPHLPCDAYLGSGMSYEAGIPTLCDMHQAFGVDDVDAHEFTHGRTDPLPDRLLHEPEDAVRAFNAVHLAALTAPPTSAQHVVKRMHRRGLIRKVFTDNVDNHLAKVGVPFERVRGSGVFNERYPAEFESRTLLVVGVAADRRDIIKQARQRGLKVIVVNPCAHVSPNVQHLNYLCPRDLMFKMVAERFFAELNEIL